MSKPIISIILPIYNVDIYLDKLMQSVIEQSLYEIEIIPVNDGSTDRCKSIIDKYSGQDKRIKPIHKINGGYGSAVNAGLAVAKGRFIGIVEGDDYIRADMYEKLLDLANHYDVDIARGSYSSFDDTGVTSENLTLGVGLGVFSLNEYPGFIVTPPAIWSAIYRTDFIKENGIKVIDTAGASYQDVDFFVRTAVLARKIICTEKPLYFYRTNNISSSSNNSMKIREIFDNYQITDLFMDKHINSASQIYAYYNKRKICDLMWHFDRIGDRYKCLFLEISSEYLKKFQRNDFKDILDYSQLFFFMMTRSHPKIYFYYKRIKSFISKQVASV